MIHVNQILPSISKKILVSCIIVVFIMAFAYVFDVKGQTPSATVSFSPETVAIAPGSNQSISITIAGNQNISNFDIDLDISGGVEFVEYNVDTADVTMEFSEDKTDDQIDAIKSKFGPLSATNTTRLLYGTSTATDEELPTSITFSMEIQKSGDANGSIASANSAVIPIPGTSDEVYDLTSNTVTVTTSDTSDCSSNWTTGDANCDGSTDNNDYNLWKSAFIDGTDLTDPDQSADFSSPQDGNIDLEDFEIWRKNTTSL